MVAKKRVADLLVDVLAEAGVRRIFGVSGDLSTESPTRFEHPENWIGSICAMKKRQAQLELEEAQLRLEQLKARLQSR